MRNNIPELVRKFYSHRTQDLSDYERSHEPRLDFLIKDLNLDKLMNSKIGDFGCGSGRLLYKLPQNQGNTYYGFDGADWAIEEYRKHYFHYDVNLDTPFYDEIWKQEDIKLDIALCFEVIEHLTAPYNLLVEIKKFLKNDGILYLSIPDADCKHNTLYPGLIFPKENFMLFLRQMAFSILRCVRHDKAFSQNVFTLQNKDWSFSRMLFHKNEDKFRNISPQEAVNI